MTTFICIAATLLAILVIPLLILGHMTETRRGRARRWRRSGMTQAQIADRLGCSRSTVQRLLAVRPAAVAGA